MTSVADLFGEALLALHNSDIKSAEAKFREIIRLDASHVPALNLLTVVLMSAGRFVDAEPFIARAVSLNQNSDVSFYNYGLISKQLDKPQQAYEQFTRALELNANVPETWNNRGTVSNDLSNYDLAIADFNSAIKLNENYVEAYANKGKSLLQLRRHDEALAAYDSALSIKPDLAEALLGRGNVLSALRRHDEALAAYDSALAVRPDLAEAMLGRGNVFTDTKRDEEALAAYDKALAVKPDFAELHHNRGNSLLRLARYSEAQTAYRYALRLKPDLFASAAALVPLLLTDGNIKEALSVAVRALENNNTSNAKALVAFCLRSPLADPSIGDVRDLLLQALAEPWGNPADLSASCIQFLSLNDQIRKGLAHIAGRPPGSKSADRFIGSSANIAALAEDRLFRTLLETTPVCHAGLELFITELRFLLLSAAVADASALETPEAELSFYCAIARQCFLNNYAFAVSEEEVQQTNALRSALSLSIAAGAVIPALTVIAAAAYFPLHSLEDAASLGDKEWPEVVKAVLEQQIFAPAEEKRLRATIAALTPIANDVSRQVRAQYEASPFPQWVKIAPGHIRESQTPDALIDDAFPLSSYVPVGNHADIDVLIAGCGTGQHAINSARRFKRAQVLAVDLSLTSLCYAKRKTRELGINNILYAQADITALSTIGRSFDVIEAVGVLHHLSEPFAGWRELLTLLRPGGIMRVGLYSDIARADVVKVREFIASRGYRATADDMRRCRREIIDLPDGDPLKGVLGYRDFYSLNECRDLLFHVQEHRLTLPMIGNFLSDNKLEFIGFELDLHVSRDYSRHFPADVAMTDLAQWHEYERQNPRAFRRMYVFWIQKK